MRDEIDMLYSDLEKWKDALAKIDNPTAAIVKDEVGKYIQRWHSYGLGRHMKKGTVSGLW